MAENEVPEFSLSDEERELSPTELKKHQQLQIAERLLRELDPGVKLEWVKAGTGEFKPGARRVIQMNG